MHSKINYPTIYRSFRYCISLLTIIVILFYVDWNQFTETIHTLQWIPIAVAIALFLGSYLIFSYKLKILLSAKQVTFSSALKANLISTFFNNILPTSIGNDIIRVFYFDRKNSIREHAAAAVIIDRISGLISQILIIVLSSAIGAISDNRNRTVFYLSSLFLISGVFLLIICILFRNRMKGVLSKLPFLHRINLDEIFDALSVYLHFRIFIYVTAISFLSNSMIIVMIMMITKSLGFEIHFFEAAILNFASTIVTLIPISIAGWGILEGIYMVLFGIITEQKEIGIAVSFGIRIFKLIPSFAGMFFYLQQGSKKKRNIRTNHDTY